MWANDEGRRDAFSSDFEPLFDIPVPQNEIFLSLVNCPAVIQNQAKPIIRSLSKGFLEVLNLQLKDFLPHGKYHAVVDADLRGRLSHSKLTNITGEQCFGDLDFSLFKWRNASMHHLSTLNMLNRNWTVSSFLASLTAEEEQRVFKLSSKKAASIRKLHTEQEQQAIQRKCQHLEEVKQRKAAMEEKKRARKEAIFDKIQLHTSKSNHKISRAAGQPEAVPAEPLGQQLHKQKCQTEESQSETWGRKLKLCKKFRHMMKVSMISTSSFQTLVFQWQSSTTVTITWVKWQPYTLKSLPVSALCSVAWSEVMHTDGHTHLMRQKSMPDTCFLQTLVCPQQMEESESCRNQKHYLNSCHGSRNYSARKIRSTMVVGGGGGGVGRSCSTSSSTGKCEWINYVYFDCNYAFLFKVSMWSKITIKKTKNSICFVVMKIWGGGGVDGGDGKIR